MTTTYELYTNENGTPKAVEGKAPAIIERVENLETSVENIETSVETAQATADACLPLIGGAMSGAIGFERGNVTGVSGTYAGIELNGNKNNPSNGATFVARAPDAQDLPNCAVIIARDGTNFHSVVLKPDGTLTKDGQTIFTSTGSWKSGNGENWYRKYNDGFIQQGGIIWFEGASGTITYHTAHKSPPVVEYNTNGDHAEYTLSSVSKTSFTWKANTSRSGYLYWRASGY